MSNSNKNKITISSFIQQILYLFQQDKILMVPILLKKINIFLKRHLKKWKNFMNL